ncbi:unnamed protein product [Soboliphyme baturini]|uniref:Lethal protein 858 n=1 Tax=Soboliphyme baturini TaxID=241478 RepID=A0A183IBG6_9BILA|nr:unnamed protein product [Soboliphyme baturini]
MVCFTWYLNFFRSWRWQHDQRSADDDRQSPDDDRKTRHYERSTSRGDYHQRSSQTERRISVEERKATRGSRKVSADLRQAHRDDRYSSNDHDRKSPDDQRRSSSDQRNPGGEKDTGRRGDRRSSSDRNEFRRDAFDRRSGHEELNDSNKRVAANEGDHDTEEWLQKKRKQLDPLLTKAGGAYIPPAKLKIMQAAIGDKSSEQYQRLSWEHLKKRIHGNVNKVNVGNMVQTVQDLLGLLARSLIQAQAFSPAFGHVYAALVAIINSKFPHIGELVLCRLIIQFKRAFRRNDKQLAITATKFVAHLVNQQVVHEVLALEILTVLLENPTDDSVEVAVAFIKECGAKLTELTPRGVNAIFERLRSILHESEIDKRVQYMIEVLFHIRKDKFSQHPPVISELDLVEEDDKITHTLMLEDAQDPQNILNVFRFDPDFEKNEEMYEEIKKEILGDDDEGGSGSEEEEDENDEESAAQLILDNTETNLVAFRRTVYLTIQSSLDFQEAIHKLLKMEIKPGMEVELCHMIIDCCAQQRTYEKFFGLMAERFCRLKKEYQENFEAIFKDTYDTIHRFEITKLRNTAKLFAHLFYTDAIGWTILSHIRLNEDDTTSASRIFIKILFQELAEFMGLEKLYERTQDPTLQEGFDGLFPRDNPRDTRFSINFFTSIGLGGLTKYELMIDLSGLFLMLVSALESDKSDEEKRKSKRKGKKDKKDKKDKLDKKTKKVSSTHHRHHQEKKHKKKTKSKHKHK